MRIINNIFTREYTGNWHLTLIETGYRTFMYAISCFHIAAQLTQAKTAVIVIPHFLSAVTLIICCMLIIWLWSRLFIGSLPKFSDSAPSNRRALRALRDTRRDSWPCPPRRSWPPPSGWWPGPCHYRHTSRQVPLINQQIIGEHGAAIATNNCKIQNIQKLNLTETTLFHTLNMFFTLIPNFFGLHLNPIWTHKVSKSKKK